MGALVPAVATLRRISGVRSMVGEDQRVRVPADSADATEQALTRAGRCNWLVDYSTADRVYCGVQAVTDGLCSEHSHNMFLGG